MSSHNWFRSWRELCTSRQSTWQRNDKEPINSTTVFTLVILLSSKFWLNDHHQILHIAHQICCNGLHNNSYHCQEGNYSKICLWSNLNPELVKTIRIHYSLVMLMWLIDTCNKWGIRWFQMRLPRSLESFYPPWVAVMIYHIQDVVDSLVVHQ